MSPNDSPTWRGVQPSWSSANNAKVVSIMAADPITSSPSRIRPKTAGLARNTVAIAGVPPAAFVAARRSGVRLSGSWMNTPITASAVIAAET